MLGGPIHILTKIPTPTTPFAETPNITGTIHSPTTWHHHYPNSSDAFASIPRESLHNLYQTTPSTALKSETFIKLANMDSNGQQRGQAPYTGVSVSVNPPSVADFEDHTDVLPTRKKGGSQFENTGSQR